MSRADINWRLAVYTAGLFGGLLWGVLGGWALSDNDGGSTAFATHSWWHTVLVSVTVFLVGVPVTVLARGIVARSVGIALVVAALSGWLMLGCLVVQGL